MFYHLKPWQSWQVVGFSFIWILKKIQTKNSFDKILSFKLWFSTFESEHLLRQKESILQKTIKRIHIINKIDGKKIKKVKTY